MDVTLRCRCGEFEALLASPAAARRAVCYCRDCRAYLHFLERGDELLDGNGGSDVLAVQPHNVKITRGADRLACMSLSEKGLYRWYASCCRTPFANTPRNPRMSYAGVSTACVAMPPAQVDAIFGPAVTHIRTQTATGPVARTRGRAFKAGLDIMRELLRSRISGKWRENPFFKPGTDAPVAAPRALSAKVRAMLTR